MEELNPVNIRYENDYNTANYRLRGEALSLKATITEAVEVDDGQWETDGGPGPVTVEIEDLWRYRASVRPGLPRKQRAARQFIKRELVKIVPLSKAPVRHPLSVMLELDQQKKEEKDAVVKIDPTVDKYLNQ